MNEENQEKTSVRLVGTGIRTRDLPNASLVRYHGATSLGNMCILRGCSVSDSFVTVMCDQMALKRPVFAPSVVTLQAVPVVP